MAELFERYGREVVEGCFDTIITRTTETFRREILSKIPDGTYVWEDYAEHDGIDEPRLARAAHHSYQDARQAGAGLQRNESTGEGADQPRRETTPTAIFSRSGSRRSFATSPIAPSAWPS